MNYEIIDIKTVKTGKDGVLSFFESERDIEFPFKRVYYIYGCSNGVQRGGHAHKELKQLLFAPYGEVLIKLTDGYKTTEIMLNKPNIGLYIKPCLWRDMIWLKDDSVLCITASDYYDENDYIRDYYEFKKYILEHKQ